MFQQNFVKVHYIRFHVNPCRGSRADTCGQTDTDGQILQPMHGDCVIYHRNFVLELSIERS